MGTVYNCSCKKCGYNTELKIGCGMEHNYFVNNYDREFKFISYLFNKGLITTIYNELFYYVPTKDLCIEKYTNKEYPNREPLDNLTIINNGYVIALCKECKEYISVLDLYYSFLYIIYEIDPSFFNREFNLKEELKLYKAKKFVQYCKKCNHKLTILRSIEKKLENNTLKCPKCSSKMESEIICMWD